MTVELKSTMPAGRLRGSAPVLAFVLIVTVVFVGLRALGMSGVANPRLKADVRAIEIGGAKYQQVVLRNDAPTDVTVDGVRSGYDVERPWPNVFESSDDVCNVRTLKPYAQRPLRAQESLTLYVRLSGEPKADVDTQGDDRVDVRVRTRSGLVRVERFSPSVSSGVVCEVSP